MGMGCGRRWGWVLWVGCGVSAAVGLGGGAWAQSATDGAIGGQVLSAAGRPIAGALVVVRGSETGLTVGARSGLGGEFLVVRLPVGEYTVTIRSAGVVLTLPATVEVGLGEVTEVEARIAQPAMGAAGSGGGTGLGSADVTEAEVAGLPVDGGDWRALAQTVPGANGVGEPDGGADEVSFRGVDLTQNSSRNDGASGDESFGGMRAGAGVEEEPGVGSDEVDGREFGRGERGELGGGWGPAGGVGVCVFAGGGAGVSRAGAGGRGGLWVRAVWAWRGGVVTTVSRSGGNEAARDGVLYGAGQRVGGGESVFDCVELREWGGDEWAGEAGGHAAAVWRERGRSGDGVWKSDRRLARMNADQGQRQRQGLGEEQRQGKDNSKSPGCSIFMRSMSSVRNFPAISAPGYAGFYQLTATQTALLANRGVTLAKTNAALNYLDSLTGTVARQADQTVNFGRVDWQRKGGSQLVLEYNRARWSAPAGARSGAVVDRGVCEHWVELWQGGLRAWRGGCRIFAAG